MKIEYTQWRKRRKRLSRRLARDLRVLSPLIGVVFCFVSSASAIVAAEQLPVGSAHVVPTTAPAPVVDYFTISNNSTSNASAAPAGILPVLRLP
jgi:hypothetical protein